MRERLAMRGLSRREVLFHLHLVAEGPLLLLHLQNALRPKLRVPSALPRELRLGVGLERAHLLCHGLRVVPP